MRPERPRAARYSFVASVVLTDLESGHKTTEKIGDLSLFGCHLIPGNTSPAGTRVRLQINHNGEVFEAHGRVANVRPVFAGMGIVFTKVEERHQQVLERWLGELRKRHQAASRSSQLAE
jgi:hypothetical protein